MGSSPLRVIVADQVDSEHLAPLLEKGIEVSNRAGIEASELREILPGFHGLIVRSRTKVTREILANAPDLRVVGRAGTGVDNIDVEAATDQGVVVMNVPGGNVVAAAEQTLALLFALARHTAAAAASVRAGKWEQKPFIGIELTGKTLGVLGLGRIGREVARRAHGLGMRVVAFDPIVAATAAEAWGVTPLSLDEVAKQADILTVHVPMAPKTRHLVDRRLLSLTRRGVRILNVARGGIIDEQALFEALESGHVAGAGLDVFEQEPPTDRRLLDHPRVVATPHLGASTVEAQTEVAKQIAHQLADYLSDGVVENAVNLISADKKLRDELKPWLTLARRLGAVAGALAGNGLSRVEIVAFGELARLPREALVSEACVGLLHASAGERINQVNATRFAKGRGIAVADRSQDSHESFQSLLRVSVQGDREHVTLDGTLFGRSTVRIVRAFGWNIDAIPDGPMLFVANEDRPGVIGHLGSVLAEAKINIANMSVGRDRKLGEALCVLNLDDEPNAATLYALKSAPGIRWIKAVGISSK